MVLEMIKESAWQDFLRDGFLHLGRVLEEKEVEALKQRADDLAMGVVSNPDLQIQLGAAGDDDGLPEVASAFEHGARPYIIQGLETDELFLRLIQKPAFREVCARMYGKHASVSISRAMLMNKMVGQGTILPWHQDGGNVWALDRDPLVTIWVALDDATTGHGCLDCIPGSHHLGLLCQSGSILSGGDVELNCPEDRVHPLEVKAGHALLLHNWLIHRSGADPSSAPCRVFTMCCMDGRTRSTLTGNRFPIIAGSLPEGSDHFLNQLLNERAALQQSAREAETYAKSLEADNQILRQMREEAESYALSLEADRARILQEQAARQKAASGETQCPEETDGQGGPLSP